MPKKKNQLYRQTVSERRSGVQKSSRTSLQRVLVVLYQSDPTRNAVNSGSLLPFLFYKTAMHSKKKIT